MYSGRKPCLQFLILLPASRSIINVVLPSHLCSSACVRACVSVSLPACLPAFCPCYQEPNRHHIFFITGCAGLLRAVLTFRIPASFFCQNTRRNMLVEVKSMMSFIDKGSMPCRLKATVSQYKIRGSMIDEMTFISLTVMDHQGMHPSVMLLMDSILSCSLQYAAFTQHCTIPFRAQYRPESALGTTENGSRQVWRTF